MGPGYFVIAILGCADGGGSCVPVATLQAHYATAAECTAASPAVLEANSQFDFPTLVARCRTGAAAKTADVQHDRPLPSRVRRG
jgi:acyl-CoA synthetase (AMP-forming)/AMP-acid ligase II